MTDEQIEQNAEKYAGHFFGESLNADARDGYIAGAHSRDEEIEKLMKQIEELKDEVAQLVNGENY